MVEFLVIGGLILIGWLFWFDLVLLFVRPLGCLRICRGCLRAVRFGWAGLLL